MFAAWVYVTYGNPLPDLIGTVLFWLFAAGALVFGTVLVVQKNPARGAIAFAFVILSTCGLFLLLAAPFLMAATIIIYAGAIIVTFLFVLMLSHADAASNENDRSREPLFGSFAGFAFVGLVLFTLYQTSQASHRPEPGAALPAACRLPVITGDERKKLADVDRPPRRGRRATRRRHEHVGRADQADRILRRNQGRSRGRRRPGRGRSPRRVRSANGSRRPAPGERTVGQTARCCSGKIRRPARC